MVCASFCLYNSSLLDCFFDKQFRELPFKSTEAVKVHPMAVTENANTIDNNDLVKVVEETRLYRLTQENNAYYCCFFDSDKNVVRKDGPIYKLPKVKLVNDKYIKLTVQAGTGLSTQYGYYYDIARNRFSEVFYWILAESNDKVAYSMADKVVIQDIFDKTIYFKEIKDFRYPFSVAIEPIIKAEFVESDKLKITYLTGENYEEVTELFMLE